MKLDFRLRPVLVSIMYALVSMCCGCHREGLVRTSFENMKVRRYRDAGMEILTPRRIPWHGHDPKGVSIGMHPVFPKSLMGEPRYVIGVSIKRYTIQKYDERMEMLARGAEIHKRKDTDPVFYEFDTWRNGFHPELSTREYHRQGGWFYVRKDIVCPNGDILVIESEIYRRMVTAEEIEAVKKMVDSVRALR